MRRSRLHPGYVKPDMEEASGNNNNHGSHEDPYQGRAEDPLKWFEPEIIPDVPEPPPPQIIKGVLYRGGKMSLTASSKGYKTWGLTDVAYSVSNGLDWWGLPTIQTPVLYVDFELMRFDYQWRVAQIRTARGKGDFSNLRRIGMRGKSMTSDLWQKLIEIVTRDKFGFVILEPQYKLFVGRDENSAGDVAEVLGNFERLAQETGAGTCSAHHHSKGNQANKEPGDRGSGSGVFFRDTDALFEIVPNKTDGAFSIISRARSFPEIEDFVVRWNFPLFHRDDSGIDPADLRQPKRSGPVQKGRPEDIAKLLGSKTLTTADLKKIVCDELGIAKTRFYELLRETESAKLIAKDTMTGEWEKCPRIQ
jgi:hypothetical protein